MSKFKVGDKVKIISCAGQTNGAFTGTVTTIHQKSGNPRYPYYLLGVPYMWCDHEIELVEPAAPDPSTATPSTEKASTLSPGASSVKVGDWVRVNPTGHVGTITEITVKMNVPQTAKFITGDLSLFTILTADQVKHHKKEQYDKEEKQHLMKIRDSVCAYEDWKGRQEKEDK